jgi:hypothetical protein
MAGVQWACAVEVTTATSTLTLLQLITTAHRRNRINRVTITGKGISGADAPVTVEVLDQSTAGTSGGSGTVAKQSPNDPETLGITAGITYSAEPTAGNIRASGNVHPQSGITFTFPQGIRDCFVGGSGVARLGIRVVSPAQATTLRVLVEGEE